MEVRRITKLCQLLAVIGASLLIAGCSESSAYVEYASLPTPATVDAGNSTTAAVGSAAESLSAVEQTIAPTTEISDDKSLTATPDTADSDASEQTGNQSDAAGSTSKNSGSNETTDQATEEVVPAVATNADQTGIALTSNETGVSSETPQAVPQDPNSDGAAEKQASGEPREIKLLIPDKRFQTEGDQQAVRISYDDFDLLKVLNMEPVPADAVDHFPEWLKNLHGKRVRLRGFMFPTFKATGLTGFSLARDNGICCFGRDPLIYDILEVDLAEGETTDYIEAKAFDVEGVFQIDPEADDTELFQLYRIEDARVLK